MTSFSRRSLRGKLLLSMSAAVILLVLLTGWLVQRHAVTTATRLVEREVRANFQAYESLWKARAGLLASASRLLSTMSDVRAAFSTGDEATIRDTAGELWSRISDSTAIFLVADPMGRTIASLGGSPDTRLPDVRRVVEGASRSFPEQASGFLSQDEQSFQVVVTPVYVQSNRGPVLLNVLVAGFRVDETVLEELREATGGSEFLFTTDDQVLASTLPPARSEALVRDLRTSAPGGLINDGQREYTSLGRPLLDVEGEPVAQLWICRSFQDVRQEIASLRRNVGFILLVALMAGVVLTHLLARRILGPVEKLDEAASQIARQNYDFRVEVASNDELGRLAGTFNSMCASIQKAREELIRQERLSTIGRMATSIVHDLRNPLAAIYGGAEMLVDSEMPPSTVRRLAGNIYRASRSIQTMLADLRNISRGRSDALELCSMHDVITAGFEPLRHIAESQHVQVRIIAPGEMECLIERGPVERVFTNLFSNSLDAMPHCGEIVVVAASESESVLVEVSDTGPGIAAEIRGCLFQPFGGSNKKNGMGLGLALSRQTMIDHGGDLWEDSLPGGGARFFLRFPLARTGRLETGERAASV